ncbi:hypothetical protein CYLTODRAFT_357474 [Cylindrobasidium torrendii FP15055 ss-10]|uniref:Helitron helicase-like domain-containing protein n=1 Tax=Cylindrobasidium torrendii FP15055 ss-10 TaxID=1314674 RepID=A0A0D7B694_9AGAR|nr:hypothetical protein CYLTODRAFT_357474 [Cylindrobasidium torrendii FP15055 ss-10]
MFTILLGTILGTTRPDRRGIFGRVKAYYGVVEAQARGSLHIHILVWLEGAPSPLDLQTRCQQDALFRGRMFTWLESIIKHDFPSGIKRRALTHCNPDTVRRPKQCMNAVLGRPPNPADPDFESRWAQYLRDVLEASGQEHTHNDTCFKKLKVSMARLSPKEKDELCRFNLPADIVKETYMDDEGSTRIRRLNAMMGGHNPTASGAMQCNTDLKFVGSGWVGMALSVYMSSYTAKASIDSAVILCALAAAVEDAEERKDTVTDEVEASRHVLRRTLNIMVGRRELSGQQVAAEILGHGNHRTNVTFGKYYWTSLLNYVSAEDFPRVAKSDTNG